METVDTMADLISWFKSTSADHMINEVLCYHAKTFHGVDMPGDFASMSIFGMKRLEATGKINVIFELVKGLGTMRSDGSDSCFPTSRMPMGMLQYMVQFFNAKPGENVGSSYFHLHS